MIRPPKNLLGWFIMLLIVTILPAYVAAISGTRGEKATGARIPMSSLKTLYFKDGAKTFARRGKKLPQLQCIGNSRHLCDTYSPDIIMCKSAGDGAWRCEADLHPSVRLGAVEVSCEGWEHPDDEYVLRGSCMLEYNILPAYAEGGGSSPFSGFSPQSGGSIFGNLFFIVFIAIVGFIVYSFFKALGGNTNNGQARGGNGRGWGWGGNGGWGPGWGGGDGGNGPPPPPYQPYPKPGSSTDSSTGWRPGLWTGMGLGALAAGVARNLFSEQQPRQQYFAGGGGQAANWGAGRRRAFLDDEDDEPVFRRSAAAGPSRSGASSSETRTSMGFGGTRNR